MLGNAIVLPPSMFKEMNVDPYCYIRARYENGESGKILYAIPFSSDYKGDSKVVAISTNLMKGINPDLEVKDKIKIEPIDTPCSDSLTVYRPYSDPYQGVCYLDPDVLSKMNIEKGNEVEVYNTQTGGRVKLIADTLFESDQNPEKVRIDLHSRDILDIDFGETVRVRPVVDADDENKSTLIPGVFGKFHDKLLEFFVGSRQVLLRVKQGNDQDEYRGIIRVNESTMGYLGVEENDRLTIEWKGKKESVQCLPTSDDDTEPLTVQVPSTIRDNIEVSNFDGVNVRRDRWYIFQKQISVSLLGILGVVFGTFQIATVTSISGILLEKVGIIGNLLLLLGVSAVLSIPVIWSLLLPVRSEVNN
ncbi:uncharacterized protein HHUB_4176 (plasmid) [Halobacterium hubeiense]|uniref:CDC48 N-terminal subdomain domain-containing protein n=1 Tax=Halobacterium hubeiense TaxID=1407499 RepID=A0A0U5D265_9EURY|nr:hypothetical protein [Halobacterium hubeiense]CQH63749.1 uncharacterized protein HHUB_4176 [Halobacterium hubeiense]